MLPSSPRGLSLLSTLKALDAVFRLCLSLLIFKFWFQVLTLSYANRCHSKSSEGEMRTLKPCSSNFFRRSRLDGWHDKLWAIALLGPVSQDRPGSIVEVGISIPMDRVDSSTGPCHLCQNLAIWSAASHSTGIRPHEGTVPGLASAWR